MMITDINGTIALNNGLAMPYLGLGTWQSAAGVEVRNAILMALEAGYRLIDTATLYQNEKSIGEAIRESCRKREDIFITTKVWNDDQGFEKTLRAYDHSLKLLGTDYIDLYLIHWPVTGKFKETWRALEKIYQDGRVKAIGISNFLKVHLDQLLPEVTIVPVVNQIEFHPYLIQQSLIDQCKNNGIHCQAWSPIMLGKVFGIPLLKEIGAQYGKNEAQVVLRWDLQRGVLTIPKSVNKERIISNIEIFDFELSEEDMSTINGLDCNRRFGYDPLLV